MSEVNVPFGDNREETATLLLAAAEDTGTPVHLIRVTETGFLAPEEVATKAGVDTDAGEVPNAGLELGDDAPDELKDGNMLPPDTGTGPLDNIVGGEADRVSSVKSDTGWKGEESDQPKPRKRAAKKATAKKAAAEDNKES